MARIQTAKMLEGAIRSAIRFVWLRSLARGDALKKARVSKGVYLCSKCNRIFNSKEIEVDHINPTIKYNETFLDLTIGELIKRYFFSELQVLCKKCHKEKTSQERKQKSEYLKQNKNGCKRT